MKPGEILSMIVLCLTGIFVILAGYIALWQHLDHRKWAKKRDADMEELRKDWKKAVQADCARGREDENAVH